MEKIRKILQKNKQILKYILFLFISTRLVLSLVGISSRALYEDKFPEKNIWKYSQKAVLDIWGAWDTGFYLDIAKRGYTTDRDFSFPVSTSPEPYGSNQTSFGFFPLYPVLISSLNPVIKDYFHASLLISNIAFLIAAFLLYKLAEKIGDLSLAKRCVKFLFLYPTAFIYSASLSESLALCFILGTIYFSKAGNYLLSGFLGALSALTKLTGLLIVIPYLFEGFKRNRNNKVFWLGFLIIPLGLLGLLGFFWLTTGNPLVYFENKALGWGNYIQNPFGTIKLLLTDIGSSPTTMKFYSIVLIFIGLQSLLLIYSYKKISTGYFLFWLLQFTVTLSSGFTVATSIPRHSTVFFPQFIVLAILTEKKSINRLFTIILLFAQAFFMALWANGLVII